MSKEDILKMLEEKLRNCETKHKTEFQSPLEHYPYNYGYLKSTIEFILNNNEKT